MIIDGKKEAENLRQEIKKEIDLLNKRPGIYSARWGGLKGDFNLAIKKVFKALDKKKKNWREEKISARFICALTIFGLKKEPIFSIGKIEGYISNEQRGLKGFGYDPIFIPRGKRKTFRRTKNLTKLNASVVKYQMFRTIFDVYSLEV